jgi:hypothetical protein
MAKRISRVLPTGDCWCGCETPDHRPTEVPRGKFFVPGHDRRAESMVIAMEYGGVAEFLAEKGFAPDEKNLFKTYAEWRKRKP